MRIKDGYHGAQNNHFKDMAPWAIMMASMIQHNNAAGIDHYRRQQQRH
ncbi:MAG: hypothetical protein IMF06_14250 [Proteobacteria bacterium]|nr:hypothetical protein [Pseudomonadota bacterium]